MKKTCAKALLTALLMTAPLGALAAETTALAPGAQGTPSPKGERVSAYSMDQDYLGVTVSDKWMLQARISGLMIDLRLFTAEGKAVTFKEGLGGIPGTKDICLTLCASRWDEDLILQLDQRAMDVLNRVGITQIVVADNHRSVRAKYDVSELQQIRDYFKLTRGEQLCVSGENNPVTVVGEDGFRRQLTQ